MPILKEDFLKPNATYHCVPEGDIGVSYLFLTPKGEVYYLQEGPPRMFTRDTIMAWTDGDGKVEKMKSMSQGRIL